MEALEMESPAKKIKVEDDDDVHSGVAPKSTAMAALHTKLDDRSNERNDGGESEVLDTEESGSDDEGEEEDDDGEEEEYDELLEGDMSAEDEDDGDDGDNYDSDV